MQHGSVKESVREKSERLKIEKRKCEIDDIHRQLSQMKRSRKACESCRKRKCERVSVRDK